MKERLASDAEAGNDIPPIHVSPLLLQIRPDRRLGHEWDDWDGAPLAGGGVFRSDVRLFFGVAALAGLVSAAALCGLVWLVEPRLGRLWATAPQILYVVTTGITALWLAWLLVLAADVRFGRSWLPPVLAERGLLPWVMKPLEGMAGRLGLSRDALGNAMLRVFNRVASSRRRGRIAADELLILLPRCLGKEAMQAAAGISQRYGVPYFVASRGRYARQMIEERRPRRVVAVACERDLVSGVHDVGKRLPVLGSTLALPDGPCRNTALDPAELENQVRTMLGLEALRAGAGSDRTVDREGATVS